jgi:hypothetical protein
MAWFLALIVCGVGGFALWHFALNPQRLGSESLSPPAHRTANSPDAPRGK